MLNEFENKMMACFHVFSDPTDPVKVSISMDEEGRYVTFQTHTVIINAHQMTIEQFLNTPEESLKAIVKGLYKDLQKPLRASLKRVV